MAYKLLSEPHHLTLGHSQLFILQLLLSATDAAAVKILSSVL